MTKQEKKALEQASVLICEDMETFCAYMLEQEVRISAPEYKISAEVCCELNKQLYFQERYESVGPTQEAYAVIQFFLFSAVRLRILKYDHMADNRIGFKTGTVYDDFRRLSNKAKYTLLFVCFLYEYAGKLKRDYRSVSGGLSELLRFLAGMQKRSFIPNTQQTRRILFEELHEYSHVLRIFHEMGLCEVEFYTAEEEGALPGSGKYYPTMFSTKVKSIKVTEAGAAAGNWFADCEEEIEIEDEGVFLPWVKLDLWSVVYTKDFVPEEWFLLQEVMAPAESESEEVYDMRVRQGNCTRTIRLSGELTLEAFHEIIQEVFVFDADHLYYFSTGFGLTEQKYYCPCAEELYPADEIVISELRLEKGDRFTYLFDFGDCWEFDIEVADVREENSSLVSVIEEEGMLPMQYGRMGGPADVQPGAGRI